MKCAVCGKEGERYAKLIRYDSERSVWVDAGGHVCSEVCGQLWSMKTPDGDFTTQQGEWK